MIVAEFRFCGAFSNEASTTESIVNAIKAVVFPQAL
jgi:hypothetical protein